MNESETRAELIDPALKASGWGVVEDTKVLREHRITAGKIQVGGSRAKPLSADYVLVYRGQKLAVIEAKSDECEVGEGVAQAKNYSKMLGVETAISTNGRQIYRICMRTGVEGLVQAFPTPQELWSKAFATRNEWRDKFNQVPFESAAVKTAHYYQEVAVNRVMDAITDGKQRILLTMATGTGKTFVAFQIVWKLFQSRWNLKRDGSRRPRVLFLADRNILADQAYNAFSAFPEDALARIKPDEIRRHGRVPTNGSIFFTIFQTFMSGPLKDGKPSPYFGDYPKDFFDFIIIDECHRGGANDESSWRDIMEYFSPAVQLGLTATPRRDINADTYRYFNDPVYVYSLKEGINDGFLTPFKVKRIKTTLDDYIYTPDDQVLEGEIEQGRLYQEPDFNRVIEIKAREAKRVQVFLSEIDPNEKTLVFCATQDHAAAVRDLVNQHKRNSDPLYCVRVTANDGALGEQYLRDFQDNEKTIPTILTTSHKLSTGVDARNIRNIVLLRPIRSMIEFKQIVGRGTRLFDGKEYFTIYDFVDAYQHFSDPAWDGEPIEPVGVGAGEPKPPRPPKGAEGPGPGPGPESPPAKIKVRLRDGKEREIQHMIATSYWGPDGKPISAEEYLKNLYGTLPEFFSNEEELRRIWSNPITRKALLEKLMDAGYGLDELAVYQRLIGAENSDLFDVLDYIAFAAKPITRGARVAKAQSKIFQVLNDQQKEFLEFVLSKYIESGVGELDQEKLPELLLLKYHALSDAQKVLGNVESIRANFIGFQKHLYEPASG